MKEQNNKRIGVILTDNDIAKVWQYVDLKLNDKKSFSRAIRELIDIGMKKVLEVE
jgi:hypothetical protein